MKKLIFTLVILTISLGNLKAQKDYAFTKAGWMVTDSVQVILLHMHTQSAEEDSLLETTEDLRSVVGKYIYEENGYIWANFPKDYITYHVDYVFGAAGGHEKTLVSVRTETTSGDTYRSSSEYFREYRLLGKGPVQICRAYEKATLTLSL